MKNELLFFFCLTFFACQKNEILYPSSVNSLSSFDEFEIGDDSKHYLLVVGKNNKSFYQKVKPLIKKYTVKNHPRGTDRTSIIYLGMDQENRIPICIIRNFRNKNEVMDFYEKIQKRPKRFLPKKIDYQLFPISQRNYRIILKNRSLDGYAEFFEANY